MSVEATGGNEHDVWLTDGEIEYLRRCFAQCLLVAQQMNLRGVMADVTQQVDMPVATGERIHVTVESRREYMPRYNMGRALHVVMFSSE